MIASPSHQAGLFYSPLARQAALLKDDLLDPVDHLLNDPALVDLVRQCLATRSPLSQRTGRTGMAPDRRLRCCVMKHLKGWSFRDRERELRSNLVYRRFTHFDAEATPDFTTFSRTFARLSPAVTEEIHQGWSAWPASKAWRKDKSFAPTRPSWKATFTILPTVRSWATAFGCSAAACNASPANVRTELWKWCITHAR
jgi:Transposase domain (DUF772)